MAQVTVRGLSDERLRELEAKLELATQAALDRVMNQIADQIGHTQTAAAEPAREPA
jgi:hypothetical protein